MAGDLDTKLVDDGSPTARQAKRWMYLVLADLTVASRVKVGLEIALQGENRSFHVLPADSHAASDLRVVGQYCQRTVG